MSPSMPRSAITRSKAVQNTLGSDSRTTPLGQGNALDNALDLIAPSVDHESYLFGSSNGEGSSQRWHFSSLESQFPLEDVAYEPESSYGTRPSDIVMNPGTSDINGFTLSSLEGLGTGHVASSNVSTSSVDSLASSASAYARKQRKRRLPSWKTVSQLRPEHKRYQCTFCTDSFKTKYDWQRHETTIHLSLEQWECTRFGPVTQDMNGTVHCVFCKHPNPTSEHTELHNSSACLSRPREERLFRRKDHLRQHLRLFHNDCTFLNHMEGWVVVIDKVQSRCGFCDAEMSSWTERQKHLARHFKKGVDMKEWKGDRGFNRQIENLVKNDIPAFMIGEQRNTVQPFSASQAEHCLEAPELAYPYEFAPIEPLLDEQLPILTAADMFHRSDAGASPSPHSHRHVERLLLTYVAREIQNGRVPSDRQLQKKMSEIIFGPDDEWDQTWADNPEWLKQFREKAGLISLPLTGGKNAFIGKDTE